MGIYLPVIGAEIEKNIFLKIKKTLYICCLKNIFFQKESSHCHVDHTSSLTGIGAGLYS